MILGAAEGEHTLQVGGAAAVDDLRHARGADERDSLDVGVIADRFDGLLPAMHDVQHSLGQPCFTQQLGDAAGGDRHLLARLEDHAVPQRDGVGDGPIGDHVGEIERRDRGDNADREAFYSTFDAAAHLEHFARGDLRKRAGELGQLGGFEDFRARLGVDLAVLLGHQCRKLVDVFLEQSLVTEKNLHPLLDGHRRPAGERSLR